MQNPLTGPDLPAKDFMARSAVDALGGVGKELTDKTH